MFIMCEDMRVSEFLNFEGGGWNVEVIEVGFNREDVEVILVNFY